MTETMNQQNTQAEGRALSRRAGAIVALLVVLALAAGVYLRYGWGVHFDEEFAAQTYEGMTTYYLNSSNHSNISIIYLHDEEDERTISDQTWRRLNRIANETDAEIITPDLATVSTDTEEEIYSILYRWYVPWQHGNESRMIYVMGDTADSPLVTGFVEYLEEQEAPSPNGVVTITDITDIMEIL